MSTTTISVQSETVLRTKPDTKQSTGPLQLAGVLEKFKYTDATPIIGREYPDVNLVDDIINAENSDELLRDLAITISQRGVVFFRRQDNLTDDIQKVFVQRLGALSGKPAESTLHIHPVLNNTSEFGVDDQEISTISSKGFGIYGSGSKDRDDRRGGAASWHSDIQFEPYPADYTSLRLTQLPSSGGDTLWASGYELYDRFSDAYQKFFEGLTATFVGEGFIKAAKENPEKVKLYEKPRGNPANIGKELRAVHPVVRTNPVTGWKSIYAIGNFPQRVNELSARESRELLDKFYKRIEENHDLQVRFKYQNKNDIAIWDNRSVFHSATNDYEKLGDRTGHRAVGIGEKPYLDPHSQSRTVALGGY